MGRWLYYIGSFADEVGGLRVIDWRWKELDLTCPKCGNPNTWTYGHRHSCNVCDYEWYIKSEQPNKEVIIAEGDGSLYIHADEAFETLFEYGHYQSVIFTQNVWKGRVKITIEKLKEDCT